MSKDVTACRPGCRWAGMVGTLPCCNYWDHPKNGLRPCPGGADCTVYEERATEKENIRQNHDREPEAPRKRRLKYCEEQVRQLYEQGKNDPEIADHCGVRPCTIRKWRHDMNLPPNPRNTKTAAKKFDRGTARLLYDSGMNDAQIAEQLGMARETIKKWRHRELLVANRVKRQEVKKCGT